MHGDVFLNKVDKGIDLNTKDNCGRTHCHAIHITLNTFERIVLLLNTHATKHANTQLYNEANLDQLSNGKLQFSILLCKH